MTKYLRKISTPSKVGSTQVIDSLNSTSKTDALSADAGRRLNEKIAEGGGISKEQLLDMVYPIGSLYMSMNATDPKDLFGGTWERIKDRFLLACGDTYANGTTGGESEVKLTVDQMPSHTHGYTRSRLFFSDPQGQNAIGYNNNIGQAIGAATHAAGGNKPHNNMPPYLAVYIWKRVS